MTVNLLNLGEILTLDVAANLIKLLPFQALQRGGATAQPFVGVVRDRPAFGQVWPRGEWQSDATVGANLPLPPPLAATVTVTPAEGSVDVSSGTPTLQLTATVFDANGNVMTGVTVEWVSLNLAFATVDQTGLVTAVAVGDVTISAVVQGKVGQALVHVFATPPAVDHVVVTPNPWQVAIAGTFQMTATAYDVHNNILSGRTITWDTDNHAVATISGTGLLTGVAAGMCNVSAVIGGKTGTAAGTVLRGPDVSDPLLYFPCDETVTTITSTGRRKDVWTAFAVDASIAGKLGNARTMKNVSVNSTDVGFFSAPGGVPDVTLGGATDWTVALWFNPSLGYWSMMHSPTSVGGWTSVLLTTDSLSGVPRTPTLNIQFKDEGVQLDGSRPRPLEVSFSTGPSSQAGYFPGIEFTALSSAWHHLAIVNDVTNARFRVFLDGNQIYQDNAINVAAIGDGKIHWAQFAAQAATLSGGTSSDWGSFDEVYIFDRALTGADLGLLVSI